MSDNAVAGDPPEPSQEPRSVHGPNALSLEARLKRQEAEMAATGPTMAEWLARMHALDWGVVDSDSMIRDIREWRDREAG
ncbi:MAG TPA: hypothetical protein VGJ95_10535 [Pseudonocardiaceae bacterium]|jgi:hypothetical protein